jgi:acyl-CoA synthetase (AMP-forming)/AMP-acid ligase II
VTGSEAVPPIGTQISALAQLAPDQPTVTCDGRTLTRAELDRSTNRLARAYADRGVGVGDYVYRRVDMFTVGGRNVYPAEIENALSAHPDVLSCLVVGVPHEDLGQVPYALVQAASALDEPTVQAFLRDRIAEYKVPRTVEFVDTPLRDDAGKARRSAVRAEVMARLRLLDAG